MGRYSSVMVIIIESGFVYCVAGVSSTTCFERTASYNGLPASLDIPTHTDNHRRALRLRQYQLVHHGTNT